MVCPLKGVYQKFLSQGSDETPKMALLLVFFYGIVVYGSYVFGNEEDLIIRYVSAGFIIIYIFTLWYFLMSSPDSNKRFLAVIGLILTCVAVSGVFIQVFALCTLGLILLCIRKTIALVIVRL